MELISGKVRPLGRTRIIQPLKSNPSHCSGNREQPLRGKYGFAAFLGNSGFFQDIPNFPLGFIPLLVPPAAPISKTRGKSTFSWFFCGIDQLIEDCTGMGSIPHIPSSHRDRVWGLQKPHPGESWERMSAGIQEENTRGDEFHGYPKGVHVLRVTGILGRDWEGRDSLLRVLLQPSLHQGILSHSASAGAEPSEKR